MPFPRGVSALQQGRNEVAAAPCDLCVLQGHWALVEGLGTPVEVGKAMILGSELDFNHFNLHRPSKMAFFLNRTDMKSGHQRPDETLCWILTAQSLIFFRLRGPGLHIGRIIQSGYAYVVVWVGGLEVWEIRGFSKIMNKYFKSSFGMFLMEKRDPH